MGKGSPSDLLIWTSALEVDEDGILTDTPVHKQPLTIVLAHNPIYCLDACLPEASNAQCRNSHANNAQVPTKEWVEGRMDGWMD